MSTNLGMPRVGRKRELKFATEKYWRQEITASELLSTATDVVDDIYTQQLNAGMLIYQQRQQQAHQDTLGASGIATF